MTEPPALADDLLTGAREIATFIYGTPARTRHVYWLVETSKIQVFRLGARLSAENRSYLTGSSAKSAPASNNVG